MCSGFSAFAVWSHNTILAQPGKAWLFSPDHSETSKYQNVYIWGWQKWLGYMILLFFSARQNDIKNDSCKWSPCMLVWNYDRPTHWLTSVICIARSVAKNIWDGNIILVLAISEGKGWYQNGWIFGKVLKVVITNPKIYVADFCHYKGVNGRLELLRKFIRFGRERLPLVPQKESLTPQQLII